MGRCSGVTTQIVQSAETYGRPQVRIHGVHVKREATLDAAFCDVCRVSESSAKAIVFEISVAVAVVVMAAAAVVVSQR